MTRQILHLFAAFLVCGSAVAQAPRSLTLEEAIVIGLANNHDVLLQKNETKILHNSVQIGNAGMLPTLDLSMAANQSTSNINQKFSTGLEVSRNGVGSGNFNTGLGLNWTLFDGFKMFVTYKKLEEIAAAGELQARQQMENTVFEIISAYYNISRQEQKKKTIVNLQELYRERVSIAQARLELGNGNLADVLQAKLELNEQISAEAQQNTLIANAKSALNILLGAEENYEFFSDSLTTPDLTELSIHQKQLETGNTALKLANSMMLQANYSWKEIRASQYPRIGVGLNYNLNRSNSEAGFALLNQNLGLTYGVNLNWNIFNGFQTKNRMENARISEYTWELNYYREKKRTQENMVQAFNRFSEAHGLIRIEMESVALAQQFTTLILERFKLGQSTSLELKDAQNSYLNAQLRLIEAQYNAKITFSEIQRLEGALLQ